jgi:hypothetical protein
VATNPEEIFAKARRRVIERHLVTGTEVPAGEDLHGEVMAELRASLSRHLRKSAKHYQVAAETNILLHWLYARREAAAEPALTDFDLAMLVSGAPVPPEITDSLGVGPEPWHPEYPCIESD